MADLHKLGLTMPPFQQTAFPFSKMPESCSVKEPYDPEDEDKTPLYQCSICSGTIPSDDTAV